MRKNIAAALIGAQIVAAGQPAMAASIEDNYTIQSQRGTFAGARMRIAFGGRESGKTRVGLTFAPIQRNQFANGPINTRFAEGIELGIASNQPLTLSLAGVSLSQRLAAAENEKDKDSTGKKILKGVAVAAIVGAAVVGGLFLFVMVNCADDRCSE